MSTEPNILPLLARQHERIFEAINLQTEAILAVSAVVQRINDLLSEPPSTEVAEAIARIEAGVEHSVRLLTDIHSIATAPVE